MIVPMIQGKPILRGCHECNYVRAYVRVLPIRVESGVAAPAKVRSPEEAKIQSHDFVRMLSRCPMLAAP